MKRVIGLMTILLLLATPVMAQFNSHQTTYVIRLYNPATSEHLFTTDIHEAAILHKNGWDQEFQSWWCTVDFGTPVYRVYSPVLQDHLYTSDANEVQVLSQNGWSVDNLGQPLFYSLGKLPIYRLYNPVSGRHLLSISEEEYNILPSMGWVQEGIAFSGIGIGYVDPLLVDPDTVAFCPYNPYVTDDGIDVNELMPQNPNVESDSNTVPPNTTTTNNR